MLQNLAQNDTNALIQKIQSLKKELNAVILAHYYQIEEIQQIADFIGDSLDLSKKAKNTQSSIIVFCGVKFMAEVAKILNPQTKVIIPTLEAGCSLEESCNPKEFFYFTQQHPDHIVITYINCSAEIKALSDIIVTSSNAKKIINSIPKAQKIIFAPDKHLGKYLMKETNRDMLLWNGTCVVHENFSEKALIKLKIRHRDAQIIAHPECPETLLNYANHIGSTSSLIKFTTKPEYNKFIVLTEKGIIYKMKQLSPNKEFIDVPGLDVAEKCNHCNVCGFMKKNTLENLYLAMYNQSPEITIKKDLAEKALKSIQRMLDLSN